MLQLGANDNKEDNIIRYRVVEITNNIQDYTECRKDTEEFPHLIELVDDEMDIFIVDENGNGYLAEEFFHLVDIKQFQGE